LRCSGCANIGAAWRRQGWNGKGWNGKGWNGKGWNGKGWNERLRSIKAWSALEQLKTAAAEKVWLTLPPQDRSDC
jgi:hypothetical protein